MNGVTLKRNLSALVVGLGLSSAGYAEPSRYEIDPLHLTIGFLVEHVGFAKVLGSFQEAGGSFQFDESTQEISDVQVVVKTCSVFTGVEDRDRHLRSGDFLDCENHPEMIFRSKGVRLIDRKGTWSGELSLLGKSRPIELAVSWNKSGVSPLTGNPYVAGMSARGTLKRSAFGMSYGVADALVGDEVELIIELEAHRK